MEALLRKNNGWTYASGECVKRTSDGTPAADALVTTWAKNDSDAKADLILSINPSELKQVKGCVTSREVWTKLESIYQSKGPARKATLLKQLILHRMEDGDDIREHIRKFFDTIDKLSEMDIEINPDLIAIMLLYSLPTTFENFRCAIASRDDLPNPEVLSIKIIDENDARKNDIRGAMQNAMIAKKPWNSNKGKSSKKSFDNKSSENKGEFKYRCSRCKIPGHKAVDYPKKGENSGQSKKPVEKVSWCATEQLTGVHGAYQTDVESRDYKWCLDSGATSHLCKELDEFTEISDSRPAKLNLASNATTEIKATGTVRLAADVQGEMKDVSLCNTLHVPSLRTNLMSVSKITHKNYDVIFKQDRAYVVRSGTVSVKEEDTKMIAN